MSRPRTAIPTTNDQPIPHGQSGQARRLGVPNGHLDVLPGIDGEQEVAAPDLHGRLGCDRLVKQR